MNILFFVFSYNQINSFYCVSIYVFESCQISFDIKNYRITSQWNFIKQNIAIILSNKLDI